MSRARCLTLFLPPWAMPRPLQLLLSLGLTYYALTRMPKVFDSMWERKQRCLLSCAARSYETRALTNACAQGA